tara:strand:+ start:13779 stop:14429 length:651 start_codon:yes stop_codon:yes gene_type:complete
MSIDLGDNVEGQPVDTDDIVVDDAASEDDSEDDSDDNISIESLDGLEPDNDDESLQSVDSVKNKDINKEDTKNISYYVSDDESDDDENDDEYLYKLDQDIKTNYIKDIHPETSIHNYEEVKKLSAVVRNLHGIVVDPLHKTIPIMTKYEYTRILGQRAKQIESGATPFVKIDNNIIDSYVIAENELSEKKIPFIIRRPIPNGGFEYWNVNDLEILF